MAELPADGASGAIADLAAAYAELQSLLLDTEDIAGFLREVASLASFLASGCSCGITMRRDHEVLTVARSDELAGQVDEIQYGHGDGPCLEALDTGRAVLVNDLADDERWGDYRIHALAYGVRSSLSIPLVVDGTVRGALNLYSRQDGSFPQLTVEESTAFARQVALSLTIMMRRTDQSRLEGQLRDALTTRAVIDQAIGIIMGRQRVTATIAFGVLRQASQTGNRKLSDVAADLITSVTGEPPGPTVPFADPR